jgi:hypothetical protein
MNGSTHPFLEKWQAQAGLTTAPERMHRVQTLACTVPPLAVTIRTRCKLGIQRRRVLLWAWLTLFPVEGPLPQIAQLRAMIFSPQEIQFSITAYIIHAP